MTTNPDGDGKREACEACGGDGIETCDNPDHGFITAFGGEIGRLGCPCCGHDPNHKMSGPCPDCSGTGLAPQFLVQHPDFKREQ